MTNKSPSFFRQIRGLLAVYWLKSADKAVCSSSRSQTRDITFHDWRVHKLIQGDRRKQIEFLYGSRWISQSQLLTNVVGATPAITKDFELPRITPLPLLQKLANEKGETTTAASRATMEIERIYGPIVFWWRNRLPGQVSMSSSREDWKGASKSLWNVLENVEPLIRLTARPLRYPVLTFTLCRGNYARQARWLGFSKDGILRVYMAWDFGWYILGATLLFHLEIRAVSTLLKPSFDSSESDVLNQCQCWRWVAGVWSG